MINFDVVIIGSGLAGLSTALKLADNKKIAIISKRALDDSSSQWAQGGIASSSSQFDSYNCLLYTSPSPRDRQKSRMPSSA